MIAFVDESHRDDGMGTYVLGCVVIPDTEPDELRDDLGRGSRFHFNRANEARRLGMLRWIGAQRLLSAGYVYRGTRLVGQYGAREQALRRLLLDLRAWDVRELVIECRRPHEDTLDAITIIGAMRGGLAPERLTYAWQKADAEPLLWPADAIAGAVRAAIWIETEYAKDLARIGTRITPAF